MKTQVEHLRRNGWKVRVYHQRQTPQGLKRIQGKNQKILPKGGLTEVSVISPEGETGSGWAECSKKDVYNRKLGVQIALGRALKSIAARA